MKIDTRRIWLIVGAIAFTGTFNAIYISWLYPHYGYMGFRYEEPSTGHLVMAWMLAVSPSIFMPLRLTRPSQFLYWVLYLVVFVPSMFIPLFARFAPLSDILTLMLFLFGGFVLLGVSYLFPLLQIRTLKSTPRVFWSLFTIGAVVLTLIVFATFLGKLSIVSFSDVYKEKRLSGGEILGTGFVGYAVSWLGNVIYPIVMAAGLVKRRRCVVLMGMAGEVFLYATAGQKSFLLSSLILIGCYMLTFKISSPFGIKCVWGVTFGLIALLLVDKVIPIASDTGGYLVLATIFMRIIGIPGLLTAVYHDFFLNNVHTYLTHINVIGWFFGYPYQKAIGYEVGYYFAGNTQLDANAHFWVMDGLASLGLVGIPVLSLFGAIVFWIVDSASRGHDPRFVSLSLSLVALSLCNGSLFTTLLTGGLGLLVILFFAMPRVEIRTVAWTFVTGK